MFLFFDFGFAWISVILVILLSIIFVLRKLNKHNKQKSHFKDVNRFLRKHHKKLGIALIITGFIHGFNSSEDILSINLGTICWLFSILLGLNYMFRKSFQKIKGWMFYHRLLTAAFIIVLLLHIYNVGIQAPFLLMDSITGSTSDNNDYSYTTDNTNLAQNTGTTPPISSNVNQQMEGLQLKDGTYEGQANGFGGILSVRIVIKGNAIMSIDIVSHNEKNPNIYSKAMNTVPEEIIDAQSLDVDTVSGATYTSVGIINAVKNALSKALISGTLPEDLSFPESGRRR